MQNTPMKQIYFAHEYENLILLQNGNDFQNVRKQLYPILHDVAEQQPESKLLHDLVMFFLTNLRYQILLLHNEHQNELLQLQHQLKVSD